ncbi:deoxyribonuclease V [Flammeovirga aprica]|uniref:Endonuclease V n=1 Tax=Flammeovirga aprica JL-4 TaxID=694437 RepID=A0A7X9XDI2_9BACT|nr:deoxyribonuclease V [Flammeovirga aprica]NME72926.1 deoxyribonuclease V [Flammeovirga aprica JL-4]
MDYIIQQQELATKVIKENKLPSEIQYIGGVDVAYQKDGEVVIAAITILDANTLELKETVLHTENVSFPYIPGLFSFRELPPVLKAFKKLSIKPDLLICDSQGYAHPRRFGFACHLGVELDIPTIGCAKKRLIGNYDTSFELKRGNAIELIDKDEVVGKVLCTQDNTKPLFVSIGHKVNLNIACEWVLFSASKYRLPETTRTADHAVREAMKRKV